MADKLKLYPNSDGSTASQTYMFFCPGCDCAHPYTVPRWTWNGSMDKPTFTPSLVCHPNTPNQRCHLNMTDGKIIFHADCHHGLKGTTVECPDWDSWNQKD